MVSTSEQKDVKLAALYSATSTLSTRDVKKKILCRWKTLNQNFIKSQSNLNISLDVSSKSNRNVYICMTKYTNTTTIPTPILNILLSQCFTQNLALRRLPTGSSISFPYNKSPNHNNRATKHRRLFYSGLGAAHFINGSLKIRAETRVYEAPR